MNPRLVAVAERTVRFAAGASFPLYLSFHPRTLESWFGIDLGGYLIGILYVILSALCPPLVSSVAIAAGAGFAGALIGCLISTAALAALTSSGSGLASFAVFMFFILPVAGLKIGRFERLTSLAALTAVYCAILMFITAFSFVENGLSVSLSIPQIINELQAADGSELPVWAWSDIREIDRILANWFANRRILNATIVISAGELKGRAIEVYCQSNNVHLMMSGGMWVVSLMWTGTNHLASIQSLLKLFGVVILFLLFSVLLPIPRFSRLLLRSEFAKILEACCCCSSEKRHDGHPSSSTTVTTPFLLPHEEMREVVREANSATLSRLMALVPLVKGAQFEAGRISFVGRFDELFKRFQHLMMIAALIKRHDMEVNERLWLELSKKVLIGSRVSHLEATIRGAEPAEPFAEDAVTDVTNVNDDIIVAPASSSPIVSGEELLEPAVQKVEQEVLSLNEGEKSWNSLSMIKSMGSLFLPLVVTVATFFKAVVALVMVNGWGWKGVDAWFRRRSTRYATQWIIGIATLVALPTFSQSYRYWGCDKPSVTENSLGIAGKFAGWTALGFLVCLMPSVENTIHKALLRIFGTVVGGIMGYTALSLFSDSTSLYIWLVVTLSVSVAFSCHPIDPLLGYNPSFGYAFQLFTYTQTIIVVEGFHKIGEPGDLALSRILGQIVGTCVAVIVSHIVLPMSLNSDSRDDICEVLGDLETYFRHVTSERYSHHEGLLSESTEVIDTAFARLHDTLFNELHVFYTTDAILKELVIEIKFLLALVSCCDDEGSIVDAALGSDIAQCFHETSLRLRECGSRPEKANSRRWRDDFGCGAKIERRLAQNTGVTRPPVRLAQRLLLAQVLRVRNLVPDGQLEKNRFDE